MSTVRRTSNAFALAVFLGSIWAAPDTASAAPLRFELPLNYSIINPCNGEYVNLTGTEDIFLYTQANAAGGFRLTFRIKSQGRGDATGADGLAASYLYHAEESFQFNDLSSGTQELTVLSKAMLIRQGEVGPGTPDDFLARLTLHITVASTGSLTASVGSVTAACPGAV